MNVSSRTPSRLVMTVAFTLTALLLGIIGAVAAGTGTVTPPPKIAFVTTNANVAPDALTVGPMAGRLGAPLFITNKEALGESTKDALVDYGAQLIIVAGGPNTVTDAVLTQIAANTGLAIKDASGAPSSGIIRVFGEGRDETAVALSTLIAKYNPKFLPVDATATDADSLDGKDSSKYSRGSNIVFATDPFLTVTGEDDTIVTADIVLPNECSGPDSWTVHVMATGYSRPKSVPAIFLAALELGTDKPGMALVQTTHPDDSMVIPWAIQWVFEDVDAGTVTARVRGWMWFGGSVDAENTTLTAQAVSNTC